MKKLYYLLLITFVISNFIGCMYYVYSGGSSDIDGIDHEHPSYINRTVLLPPEKDQIYSGAFPDFGGREYLVSETRIIDFEELAGKKTAWAYFSNNWFDGIEFPQKAVADINNNNMVPFIRSMLRSDDENYHEEKIYTM